MHHGRRPAGRSSADRARAGRAGAARGGRSDACPPPCRPSMRIHRVVPVGFRGSLRVGRSGAAVAADTASRGCSTSSRSKGSYRPNTHDEASARPAVRAPPLQGRSSAVPPAAPQTCSPAARSTSVGRNLGRSFETWSPHRPCAEDLSVRRRRVGRPLLSREGRDPCVVPSLRYAQLPSRWA